MYLKFVKIKNFRKIIQTECLFNPGLNLIVGPNDSGKSAVIDGIRYTLKQIVDDYSRISSDDFNDPNLEINIDLIFSFDDRSEEESIIDAATFAEYLSFNDSDKPELKIWYTLRSNEKDIKFPEFKVGPSKEVAIEMDARCKENLKVVYLRPLRDAGNELKAKPNSRISKILSNHKDINNGKETLTKILENFKNESENFFTSGEGEPIAKEIKRLLKMFDEQVIPSKDIKFGPTEISNYLKTLEKIALYYTDLPNPGLGTLNMIFIAAELLHLYTQKNPKLILIEEIEAHLHPQRQLKIIKALQEESKNGPQMILTTHSPNLASLIEVERLNICYNGEFYSLAKGETELANNNYNYLRRFLDVTKANLFFAQGVILVEGPTEQLLIPEISKILGYDLTDYGISIICTNGLGFEHFINIFKRKKAPYNKIPIAVITDADNKKSTDLEIKLEEIKNTNNKINGFIGEQLYKDSELNNKEKSTTFEKIIFAKTTALKKLYIDSYNTLKKRDEDAAADMNFESIYEKIKNEKAPIAQEVAQQLENLKNTDENRKIIKKEIEDYLKYLADAIKFVIPKNE